MASGRRESVLVFCISPFTKLYMPAIDHYGPDRVYVLCGTGNDPVTRLARERFEGAKKDIDCDRLEVVDVDTSDFQGVLAKITDISDSLFEMFKDDYDLFVNISSGSHEYAAAAMFSSMLSKHAVPFRVDYGDLALDNYVPVITEIDNSMQVSDPSRIRAPSNQKPDEDMLVFLKVLDKMLKVSKYAKFREIIDAVKGEGGWTYDEKRKSSAGRTTIEQKEERYLKRHYIDPAVEQGWIERPSKNTMALTDIGVDVLRIYRPIPTDSFPPPCYSMKMMGCSVNPRMVDYSLSDSRGDIDYSSYGTSGSEKGGRPLPTVRKRECGSLSFERDGKRYRFNIRRD